MTALDREPAGAPAPIQKKTTEPTADPRKNEDPRRLMADLYLDQIRRRLARLRLPGAALLVALALASPRHAQATNAHGALLVHFNPSVTYTTDVSNYFGQSGVTCPADLGCPPHTGTCYFGTDTDPTSHHPAGQGDVAFILAAFPPSECVRLSALTFGIHYDESHLVLADWGQGGDFELATANWPQSGEGTAITWNGTPITSAVSEVYWFACYAYAPSQLWLTGHPTQGGRFADDAVPSNITNIAGYGIGGLAGAPGSRPDAPTATDDTTWGLIKARFRFSTSHDPR